jgi:hypothetical protein
MRKVMRRGNFTSVEDLEAKLKTFRNRSRPGLNCSSREGGNWRNHRHVAPDHSRAVGCVAA